MRLGAWEPFAAAAGLLEHFVRVRVSEPTVRRVTERAGQAYVEVQTQQMEELERELPAAPAGPAVLQASVDGAMVPLRRKDEWAEAKLLAIGTVGPPVLNPQTGHAEVHARELSYFCRLADHATFSRLATVETHRRGIATAAVVCGVADGADWCQGFYDLHRADAVRILDHPHASSYLVTAGQAAFGAGSAATARWLEQQRERLLQGPPEEVLGALQRLQQKQTAGGASREVLAVIATSLGYLTKRCAQIRYAEFRAHGYPIGSGAVESGNKLVTEARLKRAGMHWERAHVDPMLALRTIVCSDRWDEAWPQISQRLRQQRRERATLRRAARQVAATATPASPPPCRASAPRTAERARATRRTPPREPTPAGPRRPAANHPWRRRFLPDRRPLSSAAKPSAET